MSGLNSHTMAARVCKTSVLSPPKGGHRAREWCDLSAVSLPGGCVLSGVAVWYMCVHMCVCTCVCMPQWTCVLEMRASEVMGHPLHPPTAIGQRTFALGAVWQTWKLPGLQRHLWFQHSFMARCYDYSSSWSLPQLGAAFAKNTCNKHTI